MMEAGTTLLRNLASRFAPISFFSFSPRHKRSALEGALPLIRKAAEDYWIPEANWKLRMSCARSFWIASRNFSLDGGPLKKKKLMPLQERKMIDKSRLHVRGGDGGSGCSSFRKSRQARHGAADGGNGGRGGDVILVSSAAVWDFSNLQHHLVFAFSLKPFSLFVRRSPARPCQTNGTRGGPGTSKRKVGSRGIDKIVQVPVGTLIHIVRGTIPSLDQVSHCREESAWEEWDGVNSRESNTPLLDITRQRKSASSGEREVEHIEWSSSPDLRSGNCRLESSTVSLDDSKPLVQRLGADKLNFQVNSRDISAAEPPHTHTGSDDETSMSVESLDLYDSEGDVTDEELDGSSEQEIRSSVAEFIKVGQSFIVACGGDGGKGNAAMARGRGSEKGLPSLEHEEGQPGSEADLILELKTIADVGLVGAPNAGKSTLLGSLSMAKPATGHYKFTTLRPNIGVLEYDDFFSLTVADIPGLIEGAHENRGLGHAFLRHIERTKLLAYVIDLAGGIGDDTGPLPWDQFEELVFELEQYQKGLSQRPSLIVANKIDEEGAAAALEELRRRVPLLEIYPVCAVLEEGVDALKLGLRKLMESPQAESLSLSQPKEL